VPPPEPWELSPEPEATRKDAAASKRLQSAWIYYRSSPRYSPGSIVADILSGKRIVSDPAGARMPLYMPPSYASKVETTPQAFQAPKKQLAVTENADPLSTSNRDEDEEEEEEEEEEDDDG
jgi:hypothetical protein